MTATTYALLASAAFLAPMAAAVDPVAVDISSGLVDSLLRAGPLGAILMAVYVFWPKVMAWRADERAQQERLVSAFTSTNERLLDRSDRANERVVAVLADVREDLHGLRGDVHALAAATGSSLTGPHRIVTQPTTQDRMTIPSSSVASRLGTE